MCQVCEAMDKHGIEKAVLLSRMAVDSDFRLGNKELFEAIKADDRLYGYLVVNANYPEESVQMMRSAMNSPQFAAVALFGSSSRPYPNVDDYREILNAYRRFSNPVFVYTPHAEAVVAAQQIAREFGTMKFVFGSMGGNQWKSVMTDDKLLNVYLEISGSFDAEKIEEAVELFGAHKVLLGSDLPFSDTGSMLALVKSSSVSKEAMDKILGGTAKTLFKLDGLARYEEPAEE